MKPLFVPGNCPELSIARAIGGAISNMKASQWLHKAALAWANGLGAEVDDAVASGPLSAFFPDSDSRAAACRVRKWVSACWAHCP